MHSDLIILPIKYTTSRSGAVVARWAHNPKVVCSNQASATLPKGLERKNIFRDLFVLRPSAPFFASLSFSPKIHAEHFQKSSRAFSKIMPNISKKAPELFQKSCRAFSKKVPSFFSASPHLFKQCVRASFQRWGKYRISLIVFHPFHREASRQNQDFPCADLR